MPILPAMSSGNGIVYCDTIRGDASNGDLAIYKDGSSKIIYENEIFADQLVEDGVVNLLAFDQPPQKMAKLSWIPSPEVNSLWLPIHGHLSASLTKTTISSSFQTDAPESQLSGEMAEVMKSAASRLPTIFRGGSSITYFNGQVINKPTTNGHFRKGGERHCLHVVTNPSKNVSNSVSYMLLTIFFAFSRIYESFQLRGTSVHMH